MKRYQWLAIGLAASIQLSCGRAPEAQANLKENVLVEAPLLNAPPPGEAITQNANASPSAAALATISAARLLIYHAEIQLKTSVMPRATARLDSLVRRSGGYLSAATETHADGQWRQETTIWVPLRGSNLC